MIVPDLGDLAEWMWLAKSGANSILRLVFAYPSPLLLRSVFLFRS